MYTDPYGFARSRQDDRMDQADRSGLTHQGSPSRRDSRNWRHRGMAAVTFVVGVALVTAVLLAVGTLASAS